MTRYRHVLSAVALAVSQLAVAPLTAAAPVEATTAPQPSAAPGAQAAAPVPAVPAVTAPLPAAQASDAASKPATDAAAAAASEPRIIRGNDRTLAAPKPAPQFDGAPLTFNFEEAPIADVVRVILGDVLKVDYVLHPPINGTVTLITRSPVPPDQAAFMLETALQANGLGMTRDARGTYHVGRMESVKSVGSSVRQVTKGALAPGQGIIIVPLQYIGAGEMASILKPLVPGDGIVRVDTVRNLLVLSGSRAQAEGWLDLISTFDVDLLKGMSVGVFPLKHASVSEVEAALRLMGASVGGTGGTGGAPAAPATTTTTGAAGARTAAAPVTLGESNPLYGALRVMPIERLNSILVVTPRAAYLDEARLWIERLDRPSDNSAEPRLFVYPVQNGNARHLATVLSGIFGDGRQTTGTTGTSGVAPGLTQNTANTNMFGTNNANTLGNRTGLGLGAAPQQTAQQGQAPAVTAINLVAGVRVIADEVNNAILVYSSRQEFSKIESTLKRLDVPPTQVLIEASIIEVTLKDDLQYGLQWVFSDPKNTGVGTGVLSSVSGGALGGATSGFSYTWRNSAGDVRAVLNALAGKSLINVISSPSVMVLDNHTATITVGDQQPIKTGDTSYVGTTTGAVTSTYQYKDTGVNLSVMPSVNAGNMVTMQINQAVTDVGSVDSATGQRAFLQRQIASKVAVRSGETLVLGGLIRDNSTKGKSGIPLLSELPVVGGLFGTHTTSGNRTELLVVITPRVVRSDQEIRDVSSEVRDRMQSLSRMYEQARPSPKAAEPQLNAPAVSRPN